MLRRIVVLIGIPIMLIHASYAFVGCASAAVKPATYGGELAVCDAQSKTWEDYIPCCIGVATKYQRNPDFCFPDSKDGGSK